MDINKRCQELPIIRTQKVECKSMKKENGIITPAYPVYSKEVNDWIAKFYSLDIADKNYIKNTEKLKLKQIPDLTRDETLTRITAIIRAERFCDGTIAEALKNGVLEELCVHLHEVTKE